MSGNPRGPRLVLTALLLLQCTGCLVGPDFSAACGSGCEQVARVERSVGHIRTSAQTTGKRVDWDWWTVFHDPVLDRLIEIAYEQNLTLLSAGTRVLQARAQLGIAIGEFYPQLQQGIGAISYNLVEPLPIRPPSRSPPRPIFGATSSGSHGQLGDSTSGASSAAASNPPMRPISPRSRATTTCSSRCSAMSRRPISAFARSRGRSRSPATMSCKQTQGARRSPRRSIEGGTATKLDVYQAENVLATTQATIPQLTIAAAAGAECAARAARHGAGAAWASARAVDRRIPVRAGQGGGRHSGRSAPPPARYPRRRIARPRRRARRSASPTRSSIRRSACSAPSAARPATSRQQARQDVPAVRAITFGFGPSFQWNILNYGQITNNVRLQDANLAGAISGRLSERVLKAQQEVEDGLSATSSSRARRSEYLRKSAAAAEARSGSRSSNSNGTRDFTTVLTAEQNLYAAQNNLAHGHGQGVDRVSSRSIGRSAAAGRSARATGFVAPATAEEMRRRTDWGGLLAAGGRAAAAGPRGFPGRRTVARQCRAPEW